MSSKKHEINSIIPRLQNTDGIYKFIEGMDIPKTTNSNGIFVNLSVLNDTDIDLIYEFISNIKVDEDISHLGTYEYTENETQTLTQDPPIVMKKTKDSPTYPKVKLTALQKTILAL